MIQHKYSRLGVYLAASQITWRSYLLGLGGSRYFEYPWVLGQLDRLGPRRRILDVGCGPSFLPAHLADRGHTVVPADYSLAELAWQIERAAVPRRRREHQLQPAVLDATHLAVADCSFDAVLCISVLEHVSDSGDALAVAELARALRPGGLLLLTLPYAPSYREATPPYRSGAHMRLYDAQRLDERIMRPSGLVPVDVSYIGTRSVWLSRLLIQADRYRALRVLMRWLFLVAPPAVMGPLPAEQRLSAGLVCVALQRPLQ